MKFTYQDIKRELRTVLDLGSGAGHFTQLLENPGYERKVTMLDLSRMHVTFYHLGRVLTPHRR